MRLYLLTLLIAVALTSSMALAAHVYGWHSTPGIWMMIVDLPGTIVAVWASLLFGENNNPVFYVVTALVNSAFYFYVVKGALFLKRKSSKWFSTRYPN